MITLLKHELIQTRGMLGLVAGIAVLVAAAGALLATTGWAVLAPFGLVMTTAAVLAVVPAAQVMLMVAYWRSSYGRQGYLTQTLPVKGSAIYWAKLTWASLVSLAGVVLSVLLAFAVLPLLARGASLRAADLLATVHEGWAWFVAAGPAWVVVATVAVLVLLVLIWPVQYFFAASVGSQAPLNRLGVGGPVLVWFGLYVASQVLTFVSFALVPVAVGASGGQLQVVRFDVLAELVSGNDAEVVPVGFLPALLVIALVCIAWTVRSWNRRVSLV